MINKFEIRNLKFKIGGQAVIIVLLIMVIALTVGLSISSRSIRDIRVETRTEESQRAFSAAEAGLEKALFSGCPDGQSNCTLSGNVSSNRVTYEVGVSSAGGGTDFIFPGTIAKDDTQQVWLVSHDENGNLQSCAVTGSCYLQNSINIFWGKEKTSESLSTTPALEVGIIYKEGGIYKIQKFAYDPNSGRRASNKFSDSATIGTYPVSGTNLRFKVVQSLPTGVEEITALRLRFLYNTEQHPMAVTSTVSGANIPIQGKTYDAKGHAEVSGGTESEVRRITFFKSYPSLPGIFDFVLYSGSDLNKP